MPKRPKAKIPRRRKSVQQPMFVEPEALGRVLRRIYPEVMAAVDKVLLAADSPLCPSPVWKAVQELEALVQKPPKGSSRCRPKRPVTRNVRPCPEPDAVHGPMTSPLLATVDPCVGCGLVYPDCTCA